MHRDPPGNKRSVRNHTSAEKSRCDIPRGYRNLRPTAHPTCCSTFAHAAAHTILHHQRRLKDMLLPESTCDEPSCLRLGCELLVVATSSTPSLAYEKNDWCEGVLDSNKQMAICLRTAVSLECPIQESRFPSAMMEFVPFVCIVKQRTTPPEPQIDPRPLPELIGLGAQERRAQDPVGTDCVW